MLFIICARTGLIIFETILTGKDFISSAPAATLVFIFFIRLLTSHGEVGSSIIELEIFVVLFVELILLPVSLSRGAPTFTKCSLRVFASRSVLRRNEARRSGTRCDILSGTRGLKMNLDSE
ncbi:hypothetical protein ANAPC5_01352 [Anaplasma phagocytophilum]|nr:hypothetical protein ANAPC5_01352 [Anaplasma phagocytophilum]